MRIAIVHSYYSSDVPSGENVVVDTQARILAEAGHDVAIISRSTDSERQRRLYGVRSALRVVTGRGDSPLEEIDRFDPDVVHVHNLFPNFGTAWLGQCHRPLVVTLHNFRTICANGLLFREGEICMECPTQSRWRGVEHRCYRNSVIATVPVASSLTSRSRLHPLLERADAVVTLNPMAREIFEKVGVPRSRLLVIPNGMDDPGDRTMAPEEKWLFAGRLSEEKGIMELVAEWPGAAAALHVAGSGPLQARLQAEAPGNVCLRGAMSHEALMHALPTFRGLVVPSRWYEMQPTVVTEALASGIPVVAYGVNASAALVRQFGVGATYQASGELRSALLSIEGQGAALRAHCRSTYEQEFSSVHWSHAMGALYESVLK